MSVKDALIATQKANLANLSANLSDDGATIALILDTKFRKWFFGDQQPRTGIHGSAMIHDAVNFCYREHVLASTFPEKPQSERLSNRTARIFAHGHAVHSKWQAMFRGSGIALQIEKGHRIPELDLTFTPDAVIQLMGKPRVVEIKSANTIGYKKTIEVPKMALRQCMFYMWWLKIQDGIVLMEDKNNQEFKVWPVTLDEEFIMPYIMRVHRIVRLRQVFVDQGRLPKRIEKCKTLDSPRARDCGMAEWCFSRRKRDEFMAQSVA